MRPECAELKRSADAEKPLGLVRLPINALDAASGGCWKDCTPVQKVRGDIDASGAGDGKDRVRIWTYSWQEVQGAGRGRICGFRGWNGLHERPGGAQASVGDVIRQWRYLY